MKMKLFSLITVLSATTAFAAPATMPASTDLHTTFEVLTRKSIFSKDRITYIGRPKGNLGDSGEGSRGPGSKGYRNYTPILVGSMHEDDGFVAFVENPRSGDLTNYRVGDSLANKSGVIKEITLDYILVSDGTTGTKKIMIGQTLQGGTPERPAPVSDDAPKATAATSEPASGDSTASSDAPSAPTPAAASDGGGTESIIEKMRRKRAAQMGK